jgi:hypothetical protein
MNLKIATRRRSSVAIFEDLFRAIVEGLNPHECSLIASNADDIPIFAQQWCQGGLQACVDCDSEPPVVVRPGDPDWVRFAGAEYRFVSRQLLTRESVDPFAFAAQTGRVCSPLAEGFLFDSGWERQRDSLNRVPAPTSPLPKSRSSAMPHFPPIVDSIP